MGLEMMKMITQMLTRIDSTVSSKQMLYQQGIIPERQSQLPIKLLIL